MAGCKTTLKRGINNPQNSVTLPTTTPVGDNIISNIPCDATVFVGAVVYMNGGTAENAQADSGSTVDILGIVTSKGSITTCNVQVTGFVTGIITGLTAGTKYYLSPTVAGTLTSTIPTTSGQYVLNIGKASATNQLKIEDHIPTLRS